jgi:hypothetical protein
MLSPFDHWIQRFINRIKEFLSKMDSSISGSSSHEILKHKTYIEKENNQNDYKRDDTKNNIIIEDKRILKKNNDIKNKKIEIAHNFKETKNLKTTSLTSKSRSTESIISGGYVRKTITSDEKLKKSNCKRVFALVSNSCDCLKHWYGRLSFLFGFTLTIIIVLILLTLGGYWNED